LPWSIQINPDGTLDRTFFYDIGMNNTDAREARVNIGAGGKILIVGRVFSVGEAKPRPSYAILNSDGSVDESFVPWRGRANIPAEFPPNGEGMVYDVVARAALLDDGFSRCQK